MDTPTSPECAIFEDPLLRDVVALAMPALVSAGDLSLTTLELTACIHDIPHDFSACVAEEYDDKQHCRFYLCLRAWL
jgi:hypothetical protein